MSIQHFSNQSLKRQKIFLEHPEDFTCQEKLDGSYMAFVNLCFGGNSAPSVRRKSQQGCYVHPDQWGTEFWVQNFREAHTAFNAAFKEITNQLGGGFFLNGEILSLDHPNTIRYDNAVNHVVFFEDFAKDVDVTVDVIMTDVPYTLDGRTVQYKSKQSTWRFVGLPYKPPSVFVDVVKNLDYTHDIAEQLLDKLVRNEKSHFGDTRIEGLIFRHKDGWMFKLVDRQWFTGLNSSYHAFRKHLFKSPGGRGNTFMDNFEKHYAIDPIITVDKFLGDVEHFIDEYDSIVFNPRFPDHINRRNLEALCSVRQQLLEKAQNGR